MNFFWSIITAFAKLPFDIIFGGLEAQGRGVARMSADRRIENERRRGIITVDASDRYNLNY